jgi:D-alanyl-D-alanine carboxypeptidase
MKEAMMSAFWMRNQALFAGLLALALSTTGVAQTLNKPKLDQYLDRIAEKNKAMGNIAVAKDGELLYSRSIGYGQIKGTEKEPLTSANRFRIGSISKMFTGVMVLQLVEQGKLKLEYTLDAYFPSVPNAKKITIAHLLGHKSGVFNVTESADYRSWKSKPRTSEEMVALISKNKPDFEPGTKEAYSNSNYVLLGYILEKVTGKPYQESFAERITSPLGLKDTYLASGFADSTKREVQSYRYVRDWEQVDETHMSVPGGAGAIVSTPADLAKFIHALFNLKLVAKESLDRMMKDKFAMQPYPIGGETLYGHGGSIDGFRSTLVYLPKEKLAIALTLNGAVYPSNEFVRGVLDICRDKPFTIPTFDQFAVSTERLDQYVGEYTSPSVPMKFKVSREGAKLFAGPVGRPGAPFEATAENTFRIMGGVIVLEFDPMKKQMTMKRADRVRVFTKEK